MTQREEITELLRECENLRETTSSKAVVLKRVSILLTTMIVISGVVISVTTAAGSEAVRYWSPVILGPVITALKIFLVSFKLEKQAIANLQIATKMGEFIRKIRKVQRRHLSEEEIDTTLDKLNKDLDSLKLSVFCTDSFKRIQALRASSQPIGERPTPTSETSEIV